MSGRRRVHTKAGVHDAAFEDPRPQGHVATGRLDSATAAEWLAGRATAPHRAARGSGEAPVSLRHTPTGTPRHSNGLPARGSGRARASMGTSAAPPALGDASHQGEHKRIAAPGPPEVDRSCLCTPLPASAVSSSSSTEDPAQPSAPQPRRVVQRPADLAEPRAVAMVAGAHGGPPLAWPATIVHSPRQLTTEDHVRTQGPQFRLASGRPGSAPFREDDPPAPGVPTTRSARRIGLVATHKGCPGRRPEAADSHPRSKLGKVRRPAASNRPEVLGPSGQEGLDAGLTSG